MKNLSWWKRFKLFFYYCKLVNNNRSEIEDKSNGLNLRIDSVYRLYTVYSPPVNEVKSYGPSLAEKYIKDYVGQVEKHIIDWGLSEYIGVWDIRALSEVDFLIVFGFKGFNSARVFGHFIKVLILVIIAFLTYFFMF